MKVRNILAASMSAVMLLSFAGCDLLNRKIDVDELDEISEDEWVDALEEIGFEERGYYEYANDSFSFPDGTSFKVEYEVDADSQLCTYYYSKFSDTEQAGELFEYYEELYSDVLSNNGGKFSGTKGYDSDEDSGYILLNGDFEDEDSYSPYYDVLIWKDNVVVMCYLSNINSESEVSIAKKEIDSFLDALGYPKP